MISHLENNWKILLEKELSSGYFSELEQFINKEQDSYTIFPERQNIFAALNLTPFESVKVVIIGQDPYHGLGQANGLCFSVSAGTKLPPSLLNIFKELKNDLGIPVPSSGDLCSWTRQGILLLNATLTVREGEPGSHANKGWEKFTNAVIKLLSGNKKDLVFLLWGKHAIDKRSLIDEQKHFILEAAHPSPLSAYRGFFGCRHFSRTNEILTSIGKTPVDWKIG